MLLPGNHRITPQHRHKRRKIFPDPHANSRECGARLDENAPAAAFRAPWTNDFRDYHRWNRHCKSSAAGGPSFRRSRRYCVRRAVSPQVAAGRRENFPRSPTTFAHTARRPGEAAKPWKTLVHGRSPRRVAEALFPVTSPKTGAAAGLVAGWGELYAVWEGMDTCRSLVCVGGRENRSIFSPLHDQNISGFAERTTE